MYFNVAMKEGNAQEEALAGRGKRRRHSGEHRKQTETGLLATLHCCDRIAACPAASIL